MAQLKQGMMTRHMNGEVIDGHFIAGAEIAFGDPVAVNPAGDADVVSKYGGSFTFFQGFAVRGGGSFTRNDDGLAVEKLSYQAGDLVAVAKKGFIALKVAANVTAGKRVALTTTGAIVDEDNAGAALILSGSRFTESGAANSVVEAEINFPAAEA